MLGLLYYCYTTKLFKMWDTLFKKAVKVQSKCLTTWPHELVREICSRQGSNLRSFAKFVKTLSTGVEPVTSRLTVAHSNQLSYERNSIGSHNQGSNSGQLEFSY